MWEEDMHLKHASSWSSAKPFFQLCSSFLSLVLFICETEWNEIVNLCSNCSMYTVIEVRVSVCRFMVNLLFGNIFVAVINYYSALFKYNYFCY